MLESYIPQKAACGCGKSVVEVNTKPFARFICHCRVCQKFNQAPFSDVTVSLSSQVDIIDLTSTQFERYKLPPNIKRGLCASCHKPSIELGLFDKLVIIPASNFENQVTLPSPSMHIFYHRRQRDILDELPKHSGFAHSQAQLMKALLLGLKQQF